MTAYGALIDIAGLERSETVVIPAASSSVGLAAIQIANRVGATPVALTRDRSKRQALEGAGAAHVIVTDEQERVAEILTITGGKGARVLFDAAGGPTVGKLTKAMARFGNLFHLWRAESGADAAAGVRRLGQESDDPRLHHVGSHDRPRADGAGEAVH